EQHTVSGEKIPNPKRVRRVTRSNHSQPYEIGRLSKQLPARDKSLQNDVAQVGALVQYMPQRLSRDFKHLAVAPGDCTDDGRHACQMRDIACELSFPVDRDRLRL